MKTIFYEQNQINISKKPKPGFTDIYDNPTDSQLKFIIVLFLNSKNSKVLITGDKSKILKDIKKHFKHIKAAGGVVINEKGELLLIERLGKWDLPKGKLEKGETKISGAVREVEEECGINGVSVTKKLKPSYHVYAHKNQWILKTTYWFMMKYEGTESLKPQAEENITEAMWMDMKNYNPEKMQTYPAIAKVLRQSQLLSE